jgi:nucleoside-diphosphate-sugar epimerase
MHVLVTGGAGYIGTCLVPLLLESHVDGAETSVTVVDRYYFGDASLRALATRYPGRLHLVRADVRNVDAEVFRGVDALVDLAGISNDPACELEPELTRKVNLEGCIGVAEKAMAARVGRIVFASSCSVYGHGASLSLTEDSPLHPVSLYARCKADAEAALFQLGKRRDVTVTALRFATLFGVSSRMRFDLAINVMTKNAYVNQRITVEGGGMQWRPFVHVRDVSDAILLTLRTSAAKVDGRVFNVGSNENNVRISNLAYRIRDKVPGTEIVTAPTDPDLRDYNVDFTRIRQELGFSTKRSIDDGIVEVLEALREGRIDPVGREGYTMKQYVFLADVERTFKQLSIDGRVL